MLFDLAEKELKSDPALSKAYISTLIRISEHYHVRIPAEIRSHMCKRCKMPLLPGYNASIRIIAAQRRKISKCSACGRTVSSTFKTRKS